MGVELVEFWEFIRADWFCGKGKEEIDWPIPGPELGISVSGRLNGTIM